MYMIEKNAIKKKNFYFNKIFFSFLLKKGNIGNARTVFKETFNFMFKETGLGSYGLLSTVYSKLYINFEVRQIRVRRNFHIVPIPTHPRRRCYLICKWIFDSVNSNKKPEKFSKKLSSELLKIVNNQNCESIKKKKLLKQAAANNRVNMHYRWH